MFEKKTCIKCGKQFRIGTAIPALQELCADCRTHCWECGKKMLFWSNEDALKFLERKCLCDKCYTKRLRREALGKTIDTI